jgi:hypothetical protein
MKPGVFIVGLLFSIFMGITAIAMGIGGVYPPINHIARPLVCPNGTITAEFQSYNPYPGKMVRTVTNYCVDDQTQSRTKLGMFPMVLYSGSIYGLILFVPFLGLTMLRPARQKF